MPRVECSVTNPEGFSEKYNRGTGGRIFQIIYGLTISGILDFIALK
jgi:hypothetical protein